MGFFNIDGMGNSFLGSGMSFLGNYFMQQKQFENQKQLQELQQQYNQQNMGLNYQYNEQAANNAYGRAANWFNTFNSPSAKVKQLQDAGLSVGLMYGGSGAGGAGAASSAPQGGQGGVPGSGIGQAAVGGSMAVNVNPADSAMARKLNAEADVIEKYGGEEKKANIALTNAQTQVQQSQEILNNALANDADAHRAWQDVQTRLAEIDEEIKIATKESIITLAFEKVREMQAGIQLLNENTKHSQQEREKLMPAQARWYNGQAQLLVQSIIEKQLGNKVAKATVEEAIQIIQEQARKAAAEADNEEDYIRRFDEGMTQARRDNWFELGGDVLDLTSNIFTAIYGGKVGKEIATATKTTSSGTNSDGSKWSWTRYVK